MRSVAIVGTCGLRDSDRLQTRQQFDWMVTRAIEYLRTFVPASVASESAQDWCQHNVVLVSGGTAWAGHVAVHLWMQKWCYELALHVPYRIDLRSYDARDSVAGDGATHQMHWWVLKNLVSGDDKSVAAVDVASRMHRRFESSTGVRSVEDLSKVWRARAGLSKPFARWIEHPGGIFDRNRRVLHAANYVLEFVTGASECRDRGVLGRAWVCVTVPGVTA